MKKVVLSTLVVAWLLMQPTFVLAASDDGFWCSWFGWLVAPIGGCEAAEPDATVENETGPYDYVATDTPVSESAPTPAPQPAGTTTIIKYATTTERVVAEPVYKEYVTISQSGVTESVLNSRIDEILSYVNQLYAITVDLPANRYSEPQVEVENTTAISPDDTTFVTREYLLASLDKVSDQIGDSRSSSGSGSGGGSFDSSVLTDTELLGTTEVNRLGVGTSSPYATVAIDGDLALTGALYDSAASAGQNGYILQSTVSGTQWVATSSLGISAGGSSVSFGADNQIPFTNTATNDYDYSANFSFDGSQLSLGGAGLALTGTGANISLGSNWLSGDGDDEGIYLTGSGAVGVGLATGIDASRFQIGTTGNLTAGLYPAVFASDAADSAALAVVGPLGSNGDWTGVRFGDYDAQQKAGIFFEQDDSFNRGNLYFALNRTADASNATPADALLTLSKFGRVGIGTSSPIANLSVAGDVYSTGMLTMTGSGTSTFSGGIAVGEGDGLSFTNPGVGGVQVYQDAARFGLNDLVFKRKDAPGNYVNLTFPSGMSLAANAGVNGGGSYAPFFSLDTDGGASLSNTTEGAAADRFFNINLTNGVEVAQGGLRVLGGNVGIGSSSPSVALAVDGEVRAGTTTAPLIDAGGQVCNVEAYGAVGDNSTINDTAIAAAIADCPEGGIVYFPMGEFRISEPIVLDRPVTLRGAYSPRWSYSSAPRSSIRADFGSFSGNAMIHVRDRSISGEVDHNNGGRLEHVSIDGGSASSNVTGVYFEGLVRDWKLTDVDISQMTGNGFEAAVGTGSGNPRGFTIRGLSIYSADGHGFRATALNDSYIEDLLSVGNALRGIYISSMGETKINNSRAVFNGLTGLYIDGSSNNGGLMFTDFSTDRNDRHGVRISLTGTTTVTFNGLLTRRDGANTSGGSETPYAGVAVIGTTTEQVAPVFINGLTQIVGVDDSGNPPMAPLTGVRAANASYVKVEGQLWGVNTAYQDDGGNDYFIIEDNSIVKTGIDGVSENPPPLYTDGWVKSTSSNALSYDGRINIGSSTDSRLLNIVAPSGAGARFRDTTNNVIFDMRAEDFQGFFGTFSNHQLRFQTNNTSRLTIDTNGNIGIGTTSPSHRLTVSGGMRLTGAFIDSAVSAGSNGMVLTSTGAGTQWVATSSLGFDSGPTLSFGTDNQIPFVNAAGDDFEYSDNFTFNGTDLNLGVNRGLAIDGVRYFTASTTLDNISIGENAGASYIGGLGSSNTFNVAIGYEAGRYASTTISGAGNSLNNYIGYRAGLNNSGQYNNIIGQNAGSNNTGAFNDIIGSNAGINNSGLSNALIGSQAGYNNSGDYVVAIGRAAGYNNANERTVFIGDQAGSENTGAYSSFIGVRAGYHNTGGYTNGIGYNAGIRNKGSYNNYFGYNAGYTNTGSYSDYIGYGAGQLLSASNTVAIGRESLRGGSNLSYSYSLATTSNNVALGAFTGYNIQTGGDNNLLLGYRAAYGLTTGANNIVIGYDVEAPSNTGDNQLNIGNIVFGTGIDGTGTTLSSGNVGIGTTTPATKLQVFGDVRVGDSGTNGCVQDYSGSQLIGTCTSDERLKTNITPLSANADSYLERMVALTPVTYNWNKLAGEVYQKNDDVTVTGLIAQDVEKQFPELVSKNSDGYKQIRLSNLTFYIMEAMKELWEKVTGNEERISELEERISELEARAGVTTEASSDRRSAETETETDTDTNTDAPETNEEAAEADTEASDIASTTATSSDTITGSTTTTDSEDTVTEPENASTSDSVGEAADDEFADGEVETEDQVDEVSSDTEESANATSSDTI